MIHIRTKDEVELIRKSALTVTATLTQVANFLRPGITTASIDKMAEEFIRDNGGIPSFKGYGPSYSPFPASLCISVNEVVVHGFPSNYELKDGDIISVDCGVYMNGYHGDHAYTFAIGNVKPELLKLMRVTKESLARAVAEAHEGNRIGDISFAVENYTNREHGYGVVRELVGHGVGKKLHEDPQVPNYGRRGDGKRLKENTVLAIEPMINLGTRDVLTLEDGWTIVTADGKPSVHYEHTTRVGKNKGEALSSFVPIEAAERANKELNTGHLDPVDTPAS
ncbi:MAG: type I methionyl aminopeptidase [Chitinophagales bacterium]|nr:type I methionyl aminopeptidase [Chitinophagales bacterium]